MVSVSIYLASAPPSPASEHADTEVIKFGTGTELFGTGTFWGNVINSKRHVRETLVTWYKPTFAFCLDNDSWSPQQRSIKG